jgi:predicted FMN-binding regulatory protein PaiB
LQGKWKAGQNKKERDIMGAAEKLSKINTTSAQTMSKIMTENIKTGKIQ